MAGSVAGHDELGIAPYTKGGKRVSAFSLDTAAASGGRFHAAIDRRIGLILRSAHREPFAL
jgi:hypothetical protein